MYSMEPLDTFFVSSVETAVEQSLRESKALLVYTTEGDNTWLESWFTPMVSEALKGRCVWLKLVAGSKEMGFFEQIFHDVKTPSVYCIANGQIIELITPDQPDMDYFATRLVNSVNYENSSHHAEDGAVDKKDETGAKRINEISEYRDRIRKGELSDKQERKRIIDLVKADREEIKQKSFSTSKRIAEEHVPEILIHDNIKRRSVLDSDVCTLLIKLTDGASLVHDFDSSLTLNDVRKWIDENRTDKDLPYRFHRNIPRETFEDSQELKSLLSLELTPRSALILIPVEKDGNSIRIVDAEGPGLLGRFYQGVTSWWYGNPYGRSGIKHTSTPASNYESALLSTDMYSSDPGRYSRPEATAEIRDGLPTRENLEEK